MGYCFINNRSNIQVLSAILFILALNNPLAISQQPVRFGVNYSPSWGDQHLVVLDDGKEVQLSLDEHSGAGFVSKKAFDSGFFRIKLKLPNKKHLQGVVTTFYLTSVAVGQADAGFHDELDMEFLGGNGKPYTLSTNVFANDTGSREQQFTLWFDPTADFHMYEILWNQHQIVFVVDKVPIRVFRNLKAQGVNYPSKPMFVQSSIWNASSWLGPVDWSQGPFLANYRSFPIEACEHDNSNPDGCNSPTYYWNDPKHWQLSPTERSVVQLVRNDHMIYDYCADKSKHFIECKIA